MTKRIKTYYNRTNACDICGRELIKSKTRHPRRERKEGNWTGKWLCDNCYGKDYQKNNPDSQRNIHKSITGFRTGNQDPNSSRAKGDLFEELTCIWRSTVSTVPVKNLNIENDNYCSPIDHSRDSELGIIQTKGAIYDIKNGIWHFGILGREDNKEFDNMICYCASKDGKIIERIYVFPKGEVIKRSCIGIYKNPMHKSGVPINNEKYRINDKLVNYIFQKMGGGISYVGQIR